MNKIPEFNKVLQNNSSTPFSLPPEISFSKELMSGGGITYIFRHKEHGELGHLVIKEYEGRGNSHISYYVAGDEKDPMTAKRRLMMEPIFSHFMGALELVYGKAKVAPPLNNRDVPNYIIEDMTFPCEKCGTNVAMFIYAPGAYAADQLEDYARLMYRKINELNVPTWVIGEQEGISKHEGKALVLTLLPKKEAAREILSTELNSIVDKLLENHCA